MAALFGVSTALPGFYVALCTDAPGIDSDGSIVADLEPADVAYDRQAYGVGATHWGTNANYLTNTDDIDFGIPAADWGLINHYALLDAASGGDIYAFGEFLNGQFVPAGFEFIIPAGGIIIALSALEDSIAI
jgi:hypothetical protein